MAKKVSTKKRWRKGQSSSSNPETKNHRNAAKSRFFNVSTSTSTNHPITDLKTGELDNKLYRI